MTMAGATTGLLPAGELIPYHLDHQPLRAPSVELAVEDRLPRPEVELSLGDRQDDLVVDQEVLEMGIAVVLAAAVMPLVAGVGKQLARHIVRGLLPARGSALVEPLERVLLKPGLIVV